MTREMAIVDYGLSVPAPAPEDVTGPTPHLLLRRSEAVVREQERRAAEAFRLAFQDIA